MISLIPRIIQMGSPERPQHLPHQDESGKASSVTDIPLPAGTWLSLAPPCRAHLGGSIGAPDRGVDQQRTGAHRARPLSAGGARPEGLCPEGVQSFQLWPEQQVAAQVAYSAGALLVKRSLGSGPGGRSAPESAHFRGGRPARPAPAAHPQAQPRGSHPCVPGRFHSRECAGGRVTQRATAHRISCSRETEGMSFVQVLFVG